MAERVGNIDGDTNLNPEPNIDPEIRSKDGVRNPNPALVKTPSILDRILSNPTSRPIIYTSGPNSR